MTRLVFILFTIQLQLLTPTRLFIAILAYQSPCINIFENLNEYVIFICDMAFEQLPIAQMNKCNSRKPKIFSFSLTAVTVDLFFFLTNVQNSRIVKSHTVAALW